MFQQVIKLTTLVGIIMVMAVPHAAAHGWDENWISFDHLSNGVQGHGGVTTQYQHNKYQTAVRVKRCAPTSDCNFTIDSNGKLTHSHGGTDTTIAENTKTCFNPGYSNLHGGYTCDAKTSIVSRSGGYCWATVTNRVWNASGDLAHSGDWASSLGNCS